MRLTWEERTTLLLAVQHGIEAIDRAVNELHCRNPGAFHNRDSLNHRVFLMKPSALIPMRTTPSENLSKPSPVR